MHHLLALATAAVLVGASTSSEAFVHPVRPVPMAGIANGGSTTCSRAKNSHVQLRLSPGLCNALSELPDSLEDAAAMAADACHRMSAEGTIPRCRVDFDASVGDETHATLKSSTEFAQKFVTALCVASEREGGSVRIYFADEDSAAMARRNWAAEVPPGVQFDSCGGVPADAAGDSIAVFFRPGAGEAEFAESTLRDVEEAGDGPRMSVFVNPSAADTGVTGSGTTGPPERTLQERLIDGLVPAYYLRMLKFGALTRTWPGLFTVYQEDEDAESGYSMITAMDRLPSDSEVIHAYAVASGQAFGRAQVGGGKFSEWGSKKRSDTKKSDAKNGPEKTWNSGLAP